MRVVLSVVIIVSMLLVSDMFAFGISELDAENYEADAGARSTGIDVKPISAEFNYPNSADQAKYQMFSSNYPILSFNRPANLFVIDAMKDVDIRVTITIENTGVNSSGVFSTGIQIIHDEYSKFVLLDVSVTTQSINPGSTTDITYTWAPKYSGNHSMIITTLNVNDDNVDNDDFYRHFTVGKIYDNCDDLSTWSVGSGWSSNTDTSISAGASCHVGNGQSSNYGNGMSTVLSTPVWDFSNRHPSPTRVVGFTFFVTGAAATGDGISYQSRLADGSWVEKGTITGAVDSTFADGTEWSTFTSQSGSQVVPMSPLTISDLHANSQFRFHFTSDASGTAMGYWLDDIVWYYDEMASLDEYDWRIGTSNQSSAQRGYWSDTFVTVHNDGNVSDRFIPSISGLDSEWDVAFQHESGANINSANGVEVLPGESHNIRVRLKVSPNATVGPQSFTLKVTSGQEGTIWDSQSLSIDVDPDFLPSISPQLEAALCAPGSSCEFFVDVNNVGDAAGSFDLEVTTYDLVSGWTLGLSWEQSSVISVTPGQPEQVKFIVSVPIDSEPDITSGVWLDMTSVDDPSRTDRMLIEAKSSMVTVAEIGVDATLLEGSDWEIEPGETTEVSFTLWNNATRQDVFSVGVNTEGARTWTVDLPTLTELTVNPDSSTTFTIEVTAPSSAQAGDPGPTITPFATSLRSGMNASATPFSSLVTSAIHDIVVSVIDTPPEVEPGVPTAFVLEVENDGNGPVDVEILLPEAPSTWGWWIVVDELNTSGTFQLSPSYELRDIAIVEIMLLLPPNEEPGEEFELLITAQPANGSDSSPSDNSVTVTSMTAQVRRPQISGLDTQDRTMRVGSTIEIRYTISNIGNIADPSLKTKIQLQTLPASSGVMIFLEEASKPSGDAGANEWYTFQLPARGSTEMVILILVDENVQVGTRMALTIVVEGGIGDGGLPMTLSESIIVIADERRDVQVQITAPSDPLSIGEGAEVGFVAWSNSSVVETLTLTPTIPEGWSIECDGLIVENNVTLSLLESDGLRPTFAELACTVIGPDSESNQDIIWQVSNAEGEVITSETSAIEFQAVSEAGGFEFSLEGETGKIVILSGVGIVVLIAFTLLVMAKRRSPLDEEDKYEDEIGIENEVEVMQPAQQQYQQPIPQQVVQPAQVQVAMPTEQVQVAEPTESVDAPSQTYTDEELRAAGWTQEQIEWQRQEESTAATDTSQSPAQTEPAQTENSDSGNSLDDAFASLGGN